MPEYHAGKLQASRDKADSASDLPVAASICHHILKQQTRLANLVEKRCAVWYFLNKTQALWDTCIGVHGIDSVSGRYSLRDMPQKDWRVTGKRSLKATNGPQTPYKGWIEVQFQLRKYEDILSVPVVVSPHKLEHLINDYNIIEEMIKNHCCISPDEAPAPILINNMKCIFPHVGMAKVEALVNFIRNSNSDNLHS